jgi:hypothetical protein
MLHVRVDDGRSAKFPLCAPLHNLRGVMGTGDVESLAERASTGLQVVMQPSTCTPYTLGWELRPSPCRPR